MLAVAVMPMFPLGTVLLPGGLLPLHVFEPRYRQLVVDLLADDVNEPEFGITMIERGKETGGGEVRADVGTIARIVHIEALDGGRYRLVVAGTRRLRVRSWLPDDPYPLADIDEWPDEGADDPHLADLIAGAHARIRDINRLTAEIGDRPPTAPPELTGRRTCGGGRPRDQRRPVAGHVPPRRHRAARPGRPVPVALRRLARHRLELLDAALDDIIAMIEFRRT